MTRHTSTQPLILPFKTKEAAMKAMCVKNPQAFSSIDVRENKEKGCFEVVLTPKIK